jgi:hypothetical protein
LGALSELNPMVGHHATPLPHIGSSQWAESNGGTPCHTPHIGSWIQWWDTMPHPSLTLGPLSELSAMVGLSSESVEIYLHVGSPLLLSKWICCYSDVHVFPRYTWYCQKCRVSTFPTTVSWETATTVMILRISLTRTMRTSGTPLKQSNRWVRV